MRLCRAGVAMLLFAIAAGPTIAAAQVSDGHPCRQAISCDCANINAGILSGGWKADCRKCEASILEACVKAYPPIGGAMAAAGFCELKCSVTGPHPYPKAPPKSAATKSPAQSPAKSGNDKSTPQVFGHAPMRLVCPLSMSLTTATIDGQKADGCVDRKQKRQGLWVFVNEPANEIIEILFVDGREVARTTRPKS